MTISSGGSETGEVHVGGRDAESCAPRSIASHRGKGGCGDRRSKAGSSLLRTTLVRAADHARKVDPQLARILQRPGGGAGQGRRRSRESSQDKSKPGARSTGTGRPSRSGFVDQPDGPGQQHEPVRREDLLDSRSSIGNQLTPILWVMTAPRGCCRMLVMWADGLMTPGKASVYRDPGIGARTSSHAEPPTAARAMTLVLA